MNADEETKFIDIELFGGFSISCNGKVCLNDTGSSKKVISLLQYLIVNKNNKITYDNIIYAMNLNDENKNPTSVLKNLIYRARKLLNDSGLPDYEYIIQGSGAYFWNNDVPTRVDTDIFQKYCTDAKKDDFTRTEKISLYKNAVDLYKGKLLPKNSVELWIVPLTTYYENMFENCVEALYNFMYEDGQYSAMIDICKKAIAIDPYREENYIMLIKCYCEIGKYNEVLDAYEKITDLIYDELGVKPSEELSDLYKVIMGKLNQVEKNLLVIDEDIREEDEESQGAYYSTYGVFKSMMQFTMRMFERTGQALCMLLFTVNDDKGTATDTKKRVLAMENLKTTIDLSLRRGDLFSRYSGTQYIVMLVSSDYENSGKVGQRIVDKYNKQYYSKSIKITYKVKVMDVNIN